MKNFVGFKNHSAYLVAFFFISFLQSFATGKYPVKNFTPAEYQAGIQNIDFAQNRDMTLYVANNLGIISYNGQEWERHAFRTGQKQRSLAFDERSKRLYVGSQGEFGFFEGDWQYVSLVDKVPEVHQDFDEVWDVFIHELKVYFCTFKGIYVYDGESVEVISRNGGFDKSFFSGNKLFTQTPSGQLFEINDQSLESSIKQGQTNQIVSGIIPKDGGQLLFYNSGNIELTNSLGVNAIYSQLSQSLEGQYVNHVTQLADNRLVISTQRSGLYLFDMQTQQIERITTRDGLQSNACLRAMQDHNGNLWVGMQNGMALIDINSPLRITNREIDIQGSGYEVYDSEDGRYYTTSSGIFFMPDGSTQSTFLPGTEGPAYGMQMINGKLYAGHHTGLFLLDGGTAVRRAYTEGLWQIKPLRSNPQYAIAGTYSGIHLFRLNSAGLLERVLKIKGFNESSRFFEEDRKGRIWVGQFYKGLYRLDITESMTEAKVNKVSESSDLPIQQHIILSRIDDELYLGTEKGVFKIDQNTDEIIDAEMFSGTIGKKWVYLLEQDKQKNVHFFTEDLVGFFKQVSSNNYAYVPSSLYQLRQSFNNDLLNVSKHVSDGVMFNANEGFIHYNPQLENRFRVEKLPIINRVYSAADDSTLYQRLPFDDRLKSLEPILVVQGIKVLQFFVETFKFKGINDNQFRYFLKGFDESYSEWSGATMKEYSNLKEGKYELTVQTINYLGEVVTSEPLMIEVNPPFFKSIQAKILYGIVAVFVLFQAYRLQKKYYRGKENRLEMAKEEELAQKQSELQELKEEQMQTELRHVNNLLAASTMNLVVKNEFIENIKEEIKEVQINGKVEETKKALNGIVKEIDTTLKLQEDWKQFEYHFDRVHGDFLTRLTQEFTDLTPGEQKLCAFLRLKMDTKEIANLMSISLRGVEVARYRLRKKIGLDKHQNLSKFMLEY